MTEGTSSVAVVQQLLEGAPVCANALQHELAEIIRSVRTSGRCSREFVIMNNAYFRLFSEFRPDWRTGLARLCEPFDVAFQTSVAGQAIEFRRASGSQDFRPDPAAPPDEAKSA